MRDEEAHSVARVGLSRVILLNPTPNRGARLIKTCYRVEAQARAKK